MLAGRKNSQRNPEGNETGTRIDITNGGTGVATGRETEEIGIGTGTDQGTVIAVEVAIEGGVAQQKSETRTTTLGGGVAAQTAAATGTREKETAIAAAAEIAIGITTDDEAGIEASTGDREPRTDAAAEAEVPNAGQETQSHKLDVVAHCQQQRTSI